MRLTTRLVSAALACTIASAAFAIDTYEFDTLTEQKMGRSQVSLTGVLRNTSTPTTLNIVDNSSADFRFAMSRCVPLLLTMMEKPGKYYLVIEINPADTSLQINACALKLR